VGVGTVYGSECFGFLAPGTAAKSSQDLVTFPGFLGDIFGLFLERESLVYVYPEELWR